MEVERKGWLRFSLRSLIITISVAVLILSHVLSSYRLYWTQREFDAWRRDVGGHLSDRSAELQIVSVNTGRLDDWMWRVRVPPGRRYDLVLECRDLAPTESEQETQKTRVFRLGPNHERRLLGPGETLVTFRWGRRIEGLGGVTDLVEPDRYVNMYVDASRPLRSAGRHYSDTTDRMHWMQPHWIREYAVTGATMTEMFDADSPAPLMEVHAYPIHELRNVNTNDAPKFTLKLVPTP